MSRLYVKPVSFTAVFVWDTSIPTATAALLAASVNFAHAISARVGAFEDSHQRLAGLLFRLLDRCWWKQVHQGLPFLAHCDADVWHCWLLGWYLGLCLASHHGNR